MVSFFLAANGQEKRAACDHITTAKERFDATRLLPPIKIRNYDGRVIEYTYEDRLGVYVGSFAVEADTVLPADFGKKYRIGLWWVIYCIKDNHLYAVHELGPAQKKALQ